MQFIHNPMGQKQKYKLQYNKLWQKRKKFYYYQMT